MGKVFSIAIDGPSAAGKSTIAKVISKRTGALHLDTGAMYRAFGLYMVRKGIDPWDVRAVVKALDEPQIGIAYQDGAQKVFLSDEDVTEEIRRHEISDAASAVSAVPEVREKLVMMQRGLAKGQSAVMDGRDIGTHVLPDATLKIFLVADPAVRAKRRHAELQAKGSLDSYEKVLQDLIRRDHDDSTRKASPLVKAHDAIQLDSSALSAEQVAEAVIELLEARIGGCP